MVNIFSSGEEAIKSGEEAVEMGEKAAEISEKAVKLPNEVENTEKITGNEEKQLRESYEDVKMQMAFMTWITEEEILEALIANGDSIKKDNESVSQHFKGIHYPQHIENYKGGCFSYILQKISDSLYGLRIEVKLELISNEGANVDSVINHAQEAITAYWRHYKLESNDISIQIFPTVYMDNENPDITVNVYPDSYQELIMEEVCNYEIDVRESFSFLPIIEEADENYDLKGRWPHEYGHIIGLPHDMNFNSVMRSPSVSETKDLAKGYKTYQDIYWKYGFPEAKPIPDHFKPIKVWVEYIFKEEFDQPVTFSISPL
ncbi:MAG: hypothetical protein ACFFB0_21315 [Promethearchaeota archaeon]